MFYKNTSYSAKTFYGVTFGPGETKEVDGMINNRWLVHVEGPDTTTVTKVQKEPSSGKPKKESGKPEQSKTNAKDFEVKVSDKQESKSDDAAQEVVKEDLKQEDNEAPVETK